MTDENEKKRLIIIDSNSVIHRAFHALPRLTTKEGDLVNAVYGFLLVFFKAIKDFQPDFIAAAFDFPAPTFRHKKYKEYKAKRPPTPKELAEQMPKIKKVLNAFNVPIFEKQGFEADDIIGTLVKQAAEVQKEKGLQTIIISGDMDTLQLVAPHTNVCALRKGVKDTVLYDENLVKEKYGGLTSEQLLDFKALRGDPSDNIPGVRGIGEKTAVDLLLKFGSLENIYEKIQIPNKLKTKLLEYKEQAFLSRDLAKIEKQVPIDFNLEKCQWKEYNKERVTQILKNLEFYSLVKRLPEFKKSQENNKMNKAKTKDQTEKENFSDGGQRTFKFG